MRIAFSATCGIVAVLLCVLWVRSYWFVDGGMGTVGGWFTASSSERGYCYIGGGEEDEFHEWKYYVASVPQTSPHRKLTFRIASDGAEIFVPHILLVSLLGALAISPWLHLPRQFSLRTLLIATTLVAVVLGLIVWGAR